MNSDKLVIGTRGSTLALWQARFVQSQLKEQGQASVIQIIKTTGDQKSGPLSEIGGKGLFIKELRGNVDSRLSKLDEHEFDAIVLAKAALDRLEITDLYHAIPVAVESIPPCATQGVIAIETTTDHDIERSALKKLSCDKTKIAAEFERTVLAKIGAACTTPIGVHTDLNKIFIKWQKEKQLKEWSSNFDGFNIEAITQYLLD